MSEYKKRDWTKELKLYKNFLQRKGYNIIYDGSEPTKNSGVMFVLYTENYDNPKEPNYTFFECIQSTPLSIEGFEQTVLNEQDPDTFLKMVDARVKGCTISKTDLVYGLLLSGKYKIDDIYIDNNIHVTSSSLKEASRWVNLKGGKNPTSGRLYAPRTQANK